MKRVIYDIGSNNGNDIPYYLLKADLVVAVEAIPSLCEDISKRFQDAIEAGRLVVVNCVLVDELQDAEAHVPFYISKKYSDLSQFLKPRDEDMDMFEEVQLPAQDIHSIIQQYGDPYYVKIDVEGMDGRILKSLFDAQIFPPYISAESHSADVFSSLCLLGGYNSFKLVTGASVHKDYQDLKVQTEGGVQTVNFPAYNSSGPFGDDLKGEWLDANEFFRFLAFEGLGWKDIHASRIDPPVKARRKITFKQFVKMIDWLIRSYKPKWTKTKRASR